MPCAMRKNFSLGRLPPLLHRHAIDWSPAVIIISDLARPRRMRLSAKYQHSTIPRRIHSGSIAIPACTRARGKALALLFRPDLPRLQDAGTHTRAPKPADRIFTHPVFDFAPLYPSSLHSAADTHAVGALVQVLAGTRRQRRRTDSVLPPPAPGCKKPQERQD